MDERSSSDDLNHNPSHSISQLKNTPSPKLKYNLDELKLNVDEDFLSRRISDRAYIVAHVQIPIPSR